MLTKFYGPLRGPLLKKVQQIDEMPETQGNSLREIGFEALAAEILDGFGSYETLQKVVVTLLPPVVSHDTHTATESGAVDLGITVGYPAMLDTQGATVPEWTNSEKQLLQTLLPLSKMGAGSFVVSRTEQAVQQFLVLLEDSVSLDFSDYRLCVQALAAMANQAFGYRRITQDIAV
jgi:hypothetical protein